MINAMMTDPEDPQPAASLFDAAAFPLNTYCEAFSGPGMPRPQWQPVIQALDAFGPDFLEQRQIRVGHMRREDGATYNPFNDPRGLGTPWALEMIPLTLTAEQWREIEAGVIQRARLLEQILADTYGPQNLLRFGRIPSELIFANPNFLHQCHGIQPNGDRFLTLYAVDLYRDAEGRFRVLRDHGANPAGLGYALENRIVISRVFPQLYHQIQICRLAPFFQTFHQNLIARNRLRGVDPSIVLLSPGPDSRLYFEHALLSRYLGYPLVEGQDLTVRNGNVFLKKLDALEPVEVIFRQVSDDESDPFALRKSTAAGVAGLIQVSRERRIDIVSPIGSGFIETPALAAFLPSLCQQLLGQDLLLPNHPVWWCGSPEGYAHVMNHMDQLTILPALEGDGPVPSPDGLVEKIQSSPYAYMARENVLPSCAPAWRSDGIESTYTLMRIFACATENGFSVMPGGLGITARDLPTLLSGSPKKQQSKDIWVLSDQPVEPFSLMDSLQEVSEFKRGSDLPSRVADNLLWLGRYLERAEGTIRLLRSVFRRLSGEARPDDIPELPFLFNLLKARNIVAQTAGGTRKVPRYRELSAQLKTALYQKDRPDSVVSVLERVKHAARHVRDRLSLDSWRVINRLEDFTEARANDPLELLDNTLFTLSAFSGLAMESMTRGLGWCFLDIGRRVERAMNQTSLIRMGLPRICSESRNTMEALLEVSDSLMTYRARYRTIFQLAPVLDLLIVDESNPKSLAFQFNRIAGHVELLPRQSERRFADPEERLALKMLTETRLLDLNGLGCGKNGISQDPLVGFLKSMETSLTEFSQQISAHYLSRVPTTPHFSMIPGKRKR